MTSQTVTPARVGMFPALGVTLILGLMAVLISVASIRGPAPVQTGQRTGPPAAAVPHPSPGPYGS